jgi:SseB protein N-terminal domain
VTAPEPVPAPWQPANPTERAMAEAMSAGDGAAYFREVESAELLLPAFTTDGNGGGQRFVTRDILGDTYLLVYTSVEGLASQLRGLADGYRTTSYEELSRGWPVPQWRLAINHGLPIDAYMSIDAVADAARGELAVPTGDELLASAAADHARAGMTPDEIDAALVAAARRGDVDEYIETLMSVPVLIPTAAEVDGPADILEPEFPWRAVNTGTEPVIEVFTSDAALQVAYPGLVPYVTVAAAIAVAAMPEGHGLVVNAGSRYGLTVSSAQLPALLLWPSD